MKKYLNTLFVTTQGAYLHKEGETIVVSVENKKKLQLPVTTLTGIVCFGNTIISPFLMGHCAENNVAISFLTEYGRFLSGVHGKTKGNVLLRREQYRKADDPVFSAKTASVFILGKLFNCRTVINRAVRDHGDKINAELMEKTATALQNKINELQEDKLKTLDEVRGMEGDGAGEYFAVFDQLITSQKKDFRFETRNRRPPMDNVNCLLSFLYTLLMHDVCSALESVGLDPYVGFLHRDRPGRAGLALDMMEESRPFIADRLALSLINREQVRKSDFTRSAAGGIWMGEKGRKTVLAAYQKRKQEEITHPFINETITVGLIFYVQALLLARFIRNDLDGYPVFLWK